MSDPAASKGVSANLNAFFAASSMAQENFVQRFLDRYRPPAVSEPDFAVASGQLPEDRIQQLIREGTLPITLPDVIRLMIAV